MTEAVSSHEIGTQTALPKTSLLFSRLRIENSPLQQNGDAPRDAKLSDRGFYDRFRQNEKLLQNQRQELQKIDEKIQMKLGEQPRKLSASSIEGFDSIERVPESASQATGERLGSSLELRPRPKVELNEGLSSREFQSLDASRMNVIFASLLKNYFIFVRTISG